MAAAIAGMAIAGAAYLCCLPRDLFRDTEYSKVMADRNGELLNARIAADGQWRFPPSDSVPEKFATAIIAFEDKWFRWHPGVNPFSLVRAAGQNLSSGKTVSGGSTITMQVIRLSRGRERTVWQKIVECILATRLELRCSKDEIMALYAAHAPFGGNVVGLEAAAWRYFGKPSSELSWGEAATLAVLPNAPSMIHPGRNRELLKQKRDRLLRILLDRGEIDTPTFLLACGEPLPDKPLPLPQYAPHLMGSDRIPQDVLDTRQTCAGYGNFSSIPEDARQRYPQHCQHSGHRTGLGHDTRSDAMAGMDGRPEYHRHTMLHRQDSRTDKKTGQADNLHITTIDIGLQRQAEAILERWHRDFGRQGISDIAAVVFDIRTMEVLVYCGNVSFASGRPGSQVDILQAPRSTGSILKPLLYCALLQEGSILPRTLLPDIPVNINGFSPQNYDLQFYGAVPADQALARSLNVPAVHMLRRYGVPRFHSLLTAAGMTTLTRAPEDYGLSLILGGAEGRLYEITRIYARMARQLAYPDITASAETGMHKKAVSKFHGPDRDLVMEQDNSFPFTDLEAIRWTIDALKEVNRPDEMDWRKISSVRKVAWKTGTSYGFRDAWAVGVTPEYAVGVWAGNADGTGVPGLSGATCAGPVMFDIFNFLPSGTDRTVQSSGILSDKAGRKPQCTGVHEDFRSKRNEESTLLGLPRPDGIDYTVAEVCRESGYLAGQYCDRRDTLFLPKAATRSGACPYHKAVTVSADGRYRASAAEPGARTVNMFILPPAMEWYYRQHHPEYIPVPPQRPDTASDGNWSPMEFIYPENGSTVTIPRQLDGSIRGAVFNLAHSNPQTEVYWHLDSGYLGSTRYIHQMNIIASPGEHTVTVVDASGNTLSVRFTIC